MMNRPLVRVRAVAVLDGFRVRLDFRNGEQKEVDIGPYLRGPVFQPIRDDPARFREVAVDAQAGTITWPNGADIDPDVLYHARRPADVIDQPGTGHADPLGPAPYENEAIR